MNPDPTNTESATERHVREVIEKAEGNVACFGHAGVLDLPEEATTVERHLRVVVGEPAPNGIKRGDLVTIDGEVLQVDTVVIKQTRAHVTFVGREKPWRPPLGGEVNVTRFVNDEATQALGLVRRMAEDCMSRATRAGRKAIEPIRPLAAESWIHSDLEAIATAHAEWRVVWGPILADVAEGRPFLAAAMYQRKRLRESLLGDSWRGSSTSAFSNAVEAATRAVVSAQVGSHGDLNRLAYFCESAFDTDDGDALFEMMSFPFAPSES